MSFHGGAGPRRLTARAARLSLVALLLLAAALLAACGGSSGGSSTQSASTTASGPKGGTLVWAKPAEVADLDPTLTGSATTYQLLDQIYEPLIGLDDELKPVPKLATSWEQTSPTTYVFTIRRGVKFSNGREMTVDDVVGTLKRLTDPRVASIWAVQIGTVKSVSSPSPWKVQVELAKPNSTLIPALAYINAAILPIKEMKAGTFDPARATLGTGPYKVASHSKDEVWNLVRNPSYWDRNAPKADKLTVRIMTDDAARVAALKDGSVDAANFDTPDAVRLLQGQPNIQTVVVPATEYYRLDINAKTSLLRDPRLRQALSLAIDRQQLADVALAGTSDPTSAVSPNFGTCPLADVPYGKTDIEQASKLVEQAGAKGKTISLIASPTYKPIVQIGQVLAQQFEAIGLKIRIEQPDQGEWLTRVYSGRPDFDMDISFFGSLADPPMGLNWWSSTQTWHNAWDVSDPQLEALITKSHVQPAGSERDATIKAACDRIATDAVIVPLITKPSVVAYRSDKVNMVIPKTEAYFDPMRHLPQSSVKAAG